MMKEKQIAILIIIVLVSHLEAKRGGGFSRGGGGSKSSGSWSSRPSPSRPSYSAPSYKPSPSPSYGWNTSPSKIIFKFI